ncbi:hypothetical protein H0H93_007773 [Arthromyces matolae]|nr:hypothetical protein H0H93_007773 [Arthromyces matolae]
MDSYDSVRDELPSPLLATPLYPVRDAARIQSQYVSSSTLNSLSPINSHSGFNTYAIQGVMETPGAPVVKDLDSFTEGTYTGSFADLLDENDTNELPLGSLVAHPESYNPNMSIMAWREGVETTTHQSPDPSENNAPWVGYAELPEDPLHTEALEEAGAMFWGIAIDEQEAADEDENDNSVDDERPGPSSINSIPVPPSSAPVGLMTPRVSKRARSRSPAGHSSRYVRSKSLTSLSALPDVTALPPWRSKQPFED